MTADLLKTKNKPYLEQFLRKRGVSVTKKKKSEVLDLCIRAVDLGIKPNTDNISDANSDAKHGLDARTIDGEILPHPSALSMPWTTDMRGLPMISLYDAFDYLKRRSG